MGGSAWRSEQVSGVLRKSTSLSYGEVQGPEEWMGGSA